MLGRRPHQCLHAEELCIQHAAAEIGQCVGLARLAADSRFLAGNTPDQILVKQPGQRAVQGTVAQDELALAQLLNLLQDGIPMSGLTRQAEQDKKRWFPKREVVLRVDKSLQMVFNMSVNDILAYQILPCQDRKVP